MKKDYLVIYNPAAGTKKKISGNGTERITIQQIKKILNKYEIDADYVRTKKNITCDKLVKAVIRKGYSTVIVAGGDGTVGEVANVLVNTEINLAILPLGTYMNVARMLGVPLELELAVAIIKIKRVRKIDVGVVHRLSGKKLVNPYYYLENASVGLEANLQKSISDIEHGDMRAWGRGVFDLFKDYEGTLHLVIDGQDKDARASLLTIANGPISGANLYFSPGSKMNDHYLTLNLFSSGHWKILGQLIILFLGNKPMPTSVKKIKAKAISITSNEPRFVHVDGRLFGQTPVRFSILPGALNIICGFPGQTIKALKNRKKTS